MRSVSHCGQTISLYTPHHTWCQTSYTKSTKITSQRSLLSRCVSFPFRKIPNGKAWVEEFFSTLPSGSEREHWLARLRYRVSFSPSAFPNPTPDPLHGRDDHPGNHLQAVAIGAGACGRRGVLGSDDGGERALLLDRGGHHIGRREGEDPRGAAAVWGQAGRRRHGGTRRNNSIGRVACWSIEEVGRGAQGCHARVSVAIHASGDRAVATLLGSGAGDITMGGHTARTPTETLVGRLRHLWPSEGVDHHSGVDRTAAQARKLVVPPRDRCVQCLRDVCCSFQNHLLVVVRHAVQGFYQVGRSLQNHLLG